MIDIRSTELYAQGHPGNAISIPIRQLLDKASLRLFDNLLETGKEAVLYGSDELQATAPLFLLQQLGYKNLKLLKGGLNHVNEFYPSTLATTEVSVVDTALIHGKSDQISTTATSNTRKKGEVVIPVRKGASTGGGC